MSDSHLDPHLQAEHEAPDRTTPQGTQAHGVEHGHEGRDVIFRPIFVWFGGLALFMAVTLIVLQATLGLWDLAAGPEERLPSPLFAERRPPPAPRILPNPWDIKGANPMEEVQRYPESLPKERALETEAAEKIGVLDPETGQPSLPDAAINQVISRYGSMGTAPQGSGADGPGAVTGDDGVRNLMPSDASGGTSWEDRLR